MIKVSVIVPVYNTENYLRKCLDSLVNQTLSQIEIIVVNDGSTDNSQKIIDEYAKEFSKIKSFQKPNGGLSDARNFGIDKVNGQYIGFVDSDDYVSLNMFEKMYKKAIEHQAEIVFCDLEKVNEKGKVFRDLTQSPQLPEKIELEKDFSWFGEMGCFACNKIYKSELFHNNRFKKGVHFEDIDLISRLVLKSKVVAKINQAFYKYFERQDSISRNYTSKGMDIFLALESVKTEFEKSKFHNQSKEWKRFVILQIYYSFLAYVAYIRNKKTKKEMLVRLKVAMKENRISRFDVLNYKRFDQNYLFSLPIRKQIFYLLSIIDLRIIRLI